MAIRTNVTSDRGYVYKNQYLRVVRVITLKNTIEVHVGVYDNESDTIPEHMYPHTIEFVTGPFDLYSTQNLWQQAYVYVKQRWPDSVDV